MKQHKSLRAYRERLLNFNVMFDVFERFDSNLHGRGEDRLNTPQREIFAK